MTLLETSDELGNPIYAGAILGVDGKLDVEGQDLGTGVEQAWGAGNYEYLVGVCDRAAGRRTPACGSGYWG